MAGRYPCRTATFAQCECSGAQRARFARSRRPRASESHFFRRQQNSQDALTLALPLRLVQRKAQGLTTPSRRGAPAKNIGFGAEPGAPGWGSNAWTVHVRGVKNYLKTQRRAIIFTSAARSRHAAILARDQGASCTPGRCGRVRGFPCARRCGRVRVRALTTAMVRKKPASAKTRRKRNKAYNQTRHSNESAEARQTRLAAEAATRTLANQARRRHAQLAYYAAFSKTPWLEFWKKPGESGRAVLPSLAVKSGTGRTTMMEVGARCYCAIGSKDYTLDLACGRLKGEATFSVKITEASRTHKRCTTLYPVYHTFADLRLETGTVCKFPISVKRAAEVAHEIGLAGKTLFVGPVSSLWRSAGCTRVAPYK
jgi:hypothetical protein